MTERHKTLYLMLGLGIGIVMANWGGWAVIAFFIGLVVGWNLSWSVDSITEQDMEADEKQRKRRTVWINLGLGVIFGLLLGSHHERPK